MLFKLAMRTQNKPCTVIIGPFWPSVIFGLSCLECFDTPAIL
jgi:hypothetical protein